MWWGVAKCDKVCQGVARCGKVWQGLARCVKVYPKCVKIWQEQLVRCVKVF